MLLINGAHRQEKITAGTPYNMGVQRSCQECQPDLWPEVLETGVPG